MSKVLITRSKLDNLATTIGAKSGTPLPLTLDQMNTAVQNMDASMNTQAYAGRASRTANSYGATSVTLTVAKTGTYNVSWCAWRSSSSVTMGTNLYVNGTAGTNQETFADTYGQHITLTGQHYDAGDVLTLYATSGSNSETINVANLVIVQTA